MRAPSSLLPLSIIVSLALAACGTPVDQNPPVENPCAEVACGPGRCVLDDGAALCLCDPGHHAEGLSCVEDPPADPCEPNPCTQAHRTVCTAKEDTALCGCEEGYVDRDGTCAVDDPCQPNPCTEVNRSICTANGGVAACGCDPGYVLDGAGCAPELPASCAKRHTSGDSHEPDECPALARDIGTGGLQLEGHSIQPAADEDWFRIASTVGRVYRVSVAGVAGLQVSVEVFEAESTIPAARDTRGGSQVELGVKAASSPLLVRVRAADPAKTGQYTVSIRDEGTDDYADSPAGAELLGFGSATTGRLQFFEDADVFASTLPAGNTFEFSAGWTGSSGPLLTVELIGPDATTVLTSDESVSPKLLTRITATGVYYLRIREKTGLALGEYSLVPRDLGADDHGDGIAEATTTTPSTSAQSGAIERPGDADLFAFSPIAGHVYAFTCTPTGFSCHVMLYDAGGNLLASDTSGSTGSIVRKFTSAAPAYFRVVASSGAASGTYAWKLEDLGPDDHGDTLADATPITVSSTLTPGRWEFPGDADVLRFTAVAGHIYRFRCIQPGGASCYAKVLDSTGAPLLSDTNGGDATLVLEFADGGDYYVELTTFTSSTGAWSWSLEDLGPDDHGDDAAGATQVLPSSTLTPANWETAGDADWFRFDAQASHIYRFSCVQPGGTSCYAKLRDASGSVLAQDVNGGDATLTWRFLQGGTFYVELTTSASNVGGTYRYGLEDLGVDDHADVFADATLVAPSANGTGGKWEVAGDQDVFKFEAQKDHIYRFSCIQPGGSSCYARLESYRQGAYAVEQADTNGGDAYLTFEAPADETWYVVLTTIPTSIGTYTWRLEDLGTDDHGDALAAATPIAVSPSSTPGRWETAGDRDWLKFTASADRVYRFTCNYDGSNSCYAKLYDAAGTLLLADTTTGSSSLTYEITASGDYYVELYSFATAIGSYSFRLEELGADDHGDERASATQVTTSATSTPGKFETAGDRDWLKFDAVAGHIYRFTCSYDGSSSCYSKLYDAAGTLLASDTSSGSSTLVYEFDTAGIYYVELYTSTSALATYSWKLEDLGLDDHGEELAGATLVAPSATFAGGKWETPGDYDWLKFDAVAGHVYRFTCSYDGINSCYSRFIAAPDTVLQQDLTSGSSSLVYEFSTAGTYYIATSTSSTATGSYSWKLEDLGTDDHGDDALNATQIAPAASATAGALESPGDSDWLKFTATAGHAYRFTCNRSTVSCYVNLRDPSGVSVRTSTSSTSSVVAHEIPADGTWFVELTAPAGFNVGAYSFRLEDLGPDDHGDDRQSATPISPGASLARGVWETFGDTDWFSFGVRTGKQYRFTCNRVGAASCFASVRTGANGVVAANSSATNSSLTFTATANETWTVLVYTHTFSTDSYDYKLEELP